MVCYTYIDLTYIIDYIYLFIFLFFAWCYI